MAMLSGNLPRTDSSWTAVCEDCATSWAVPEVTNPHFAAWTHAQRTGHRAVVVFASTTYIDPGEPRATQGADHG